MIWILFATLGCWSPAEVPGPWKGFTIHPVVSEGGTVMPHRGHDTPLRVGDAAIDGSCIRSGRVGKNDRYGPKIQATLTDACAPRFTALTRANVGKEIALVVNGEVYSAPQIAEPITGGKFMLTLGFDEDAETLLKALSAP